MKTAILIDGDFFLRRARKLFPQTDHSDAATVACKMHAYACSHLEQKNGRNSAKRPETRHLYRIFVYDCPPFKKTLTNPQTNKQINFSKTEMAIFRDTLHHELRGKRLTALRLGHIPEKIKDWQLSSKAVKDLFSGKRTVFEIEEWELFPAIRQKGVDMRIGIDIASLAYKKLVDQIVLISGDSDFVPAAKLARREGIDFILDPMWNQISPDLNEHIDGLETKCPKPTTKK